MFGKSNNFNPYNRFPEQGRPQLYEEQYEQSDPQPLIEEVDQNYQPTDKQIRKYAVEQLGMSLPEDQSLLYLAREGLTAPLLPNWLIYKGRDGEVYYKHRITQQKTYNHPTDTQYRMKYEQTKEKAARKNLKSMNLKASNSNNTASNLFGSKLSNSNFIGGSSILPLNIQPSSSLKLDPKIQQQYEDQLEMQEDRLKSQWKKFQQSQRKDFQNREKKMRQDYQSQKNQSHSDKNSKVKISQRIQQEKQKIKQSIEQKYQNQRLDQLRIYQRSAEDKIVQFSNLYQEDNKFKVNKYEQDKNQAFSQRQNQHDQIFNKLSLIKDNKKRQMEQTLVQLKRELQSGQNKQIENAAFQALQQQLNRIRQEYAIKIKEKTQELEHQYNQTKRLLGHDQNSYLSQLAIKKTRLKNISQQKIDSIKNKQIQSLSAKFSNILQLELRTLKESLQHEYSSLFEQQKTRQQQKLAKEKYKIDKQFDLKSTNQIANIYEQLKIKIKAYETDMNKKLSAAQQKFITDIYDKSKGQSKDIVLKLQIKEKEMTIQNKTFIIQSIKNQMQLERLTFQLLKIQSQVCKCTDEQSKDQLLTNIAKKYGLQYRTEQYLRQESRYKQMRAQYKKDKQFLASIMNALDAKSRAGGIGSIALLKQYNQDVRTLRENEEQLRKIQSLLKKIQFKDLNALQELANAHFEYKTIQLSKQMPSIGLEAQLATETKQEGSYRSNQNIESKGIEQKLKQHSRFLLTMRNELNRKLYQIRANMQY